MPKRRNQIIIISDQKRLCEKNREVKKVPSVTLSKKEETLLIKDTQSPFKRKGTYSDRSLDVLGKGEVNLKLY